LFDGVFDAREFDADIVDGEAGDLGDFAVAEAFEEERDHESILIRELGDGGAEGSEALLVFEILLGAGGGVGEFGELFSALPFAAVEERGVDGDAVEPGAGLGFAAEGGEGIPDVGHDFLEEVLDLGGAVEVGEAEALAFQTLDMISWKRSSTSAALLR
jgi:hypothetical protein